MLGEVHLPRIPHGFGNFEPSSNHSHGDEHFSEVTLFHENDVFEAVLFGFGNVFEEGDKTLLNDSLLKDLERNLLLSLIIFRNITAFPKSFEIPLDEIMGSFAVINLLFGVFLESNQH